MLKGANFSAFSVHIFAIAQEILNIVNKWIWLVRAEKQDDYSARLPVAYFSVLEIAVRSFFNLCLPFLTPVVNNGVLY
ncbi:hypothetical protein [Atlantibacter sp.]|uniref:hypothetical protein n=1 Tax=Atlantibacter sp. TaxID=1903473 RepID=UPI0028B1EE44|nr:hypothetical protein [Atlantibacter sp.]